jgi:hypothetical protein
MREMCDKQVSSFIQGTKNGININDQGRKQHAI